MEPRNALLEIVRTLVDAFGVDIRFWMGKAAFNRRRPLRPLRCSPFRTADSGKGKSPCLDWHIPKISGLLVVSICAEHNS
jgi:hypothetical protein